MAAWVAELQPTRQHRDSGTIGSQRTAVRAGVNSECSLTPSCLVASAGQTGSVLPHSRWSLQGLRLVVHRREERLSVSLTLTKRGGQPLFGHKYSSTVCPGSRALNRALLAGIPAQKTTNQGAGLPPDMKPLSSASGQRVRLADRNYGCETTVGGLVDDSAEVCYHFGVGLHGRLQFLVAGAELPVAFFEFGSSGPP